MTAPASSDLLLDLATQVLVRRWTLSAKAGSAALLAAAQELRLEVDDLASSWVLRDPGRPGSLSWSQRPATRTAGRRLGVTTRVPALLWATDDRTVIHVLTVELPPRSTPAATDDEGQ